MEMQFIEFLYAHHTPFLDRFFSLITVLGNKGIFWIALGLLFFILAKKKKTGACMLIALLLGAVFGNLIIKNIVMRSRPFWVNPGLQLIIKSPSDYSFPSGHTLSSFGASVALYKNRKTLGRIFIVVAALVAFSRLYLSVHYPSDVICGMAMGIFFGNISPVLYEKKVKAFLEALCRKLHIRYEK